MPQLMRIARDLSRTTQVGGQKVRKSDEKSPKSHHRQHRWHSEAVVRTGKLGFFCLDVMGRRFAPSERRAGGPYAERWDSRFPASRVLWLDFTMEP